MRHALGVAGRRWRPTAAGRARPVQWPQLGNGGIEGCRGRQIWAVQSSKRRLLQPPSCPLPPLGGASVVAKKTGRAPLEKSKGRQWESKRPFAKKNLLQTFRGAKWKWYRHYTPLILWYVVHWKRTCWIIHDKLYYTYYYFLVEISKIDLLKYLIECFKLEVIGGMSSEHNTFVRIKNSEKKYLMGNKIRKSGFKLYLWKLNDRINT